MPMTKRPQVLLWCQSPAPYVEAIKVAGLADRIVIHTAAPGAEPPAEQLEQAEVLMAYNVPPGTLAAMPKLRWVQSMLAGVEGWLALPDPPASLLLTCA